MNDLVEGSVRIFVTVVGMLTELFLGAAGIVATAMFLWICWAQREIPLSLKVDVYPLLFFIIFVFTLILLHRRISWIGYKDVGVGITPAESKSLIQKVKQEDKNEAETGKRLKEKFNITLEIGGEAQ